LLNKSVGPFGGSGKKHKADSKGDRILAATDPINIRIKDIEILGDYQNWDKRFIRIHSRINID
jgi:hypothetical protein